MFYLIFAILLVIFYIFAVPQNVKGTLNVMALVVAVVGLFTIIGLAIFKILQSPLEVWLGMFMAVLTYFVLTDLQKMKKK